MFERYKELKIEDKKGNNQSKLGLPLWDSAAYAHPLCHHRSCLCTEVTQYHPTSLHDIQHKVISTIL